MQRVRTILDKIILSLNILTFGLFHVVRGLNRNNSRAEMPAILAGFHVTRPLLTLNNSDEFFQGFSGFAYWWCELPVNRIFVVVIHQKVAVGFADLNLFIGFGDADTNIFQLRRRYQFPLLQRSGDQLWRHHRCDTLLRRSEPHGSPQAFDLLISQWREEDGLYPVILH